MNHRDLAEVLSRAEKFLAQGEPLLAYDAASEGLTESPNHVRLRQLQGLALARSGAAARANIILKTLHEENHADEETLGMLGRTFKDLAANAKRSADRKELLKRAAEIYGDAYKSTGGYWSGINAATMNLLVGETDRAAALAKRVRAQCLQEIEDPSGDSYWELAALGEVALISHSLSEASNWYVRAAEQGKGRFGDLQSSRRNARLILEHWGTNARWIDDYLRIPNVVVFAGHMIDRPDRAARRFPPELEPAVAKQIQSEVSDMNPGFGFASAACGSDILFLEAMIARGAEVSIVLPYDRDEFIRDSVDFVPNSNWRLRFDRVLERANHVIVASPQKLEIGGIAYEFCNDLLLGLASIRSCQLETNLVPLSVWDGMTGDGPGGAGSAVQNWRKAGLEPRIINLGKVTGGGSLLPGRQRRSPRKNQKSERRPSLQRFRSRIVSILFADAVGFSKLSEPEVPRFVQHFLGAISTLSRRFARSVLAKNTWGDGLYFVFSDVHAAGRFALALADLASNSDWKRRGLPAEISLRIALHAGPVYEFDDPITGHRSYSGTHVSRAARIEPITPRGQVYASQAFAALAAAHAAKDFVCDYVGQTPMAKGYGTLPTYHVRARRSKAPPDR
ncbi:MAG TPA: TRAFs-binding domain-containing protein [Chthoniobacterales bacterium]|nr:TRAFs-binding domain-containing protein [Chthoniobacterales bacterium]